MRYRPKYKLEVDPETGRESELTIYRKHGFYGLSAPIRREPLHRDIQKHVAEAHTIMQLQLGGHSSLETRWQFAPKTGLGFQQTDARQLKDRELGLASLLGELRETIDSNQRVLVAAALTMRRRYLALGEVSLDPEKWPTLKQCEPQHTAYVGAWRKRVGTFSVGNNNQSSGMRRSPERVPSTFGGGSSGFVVPLPPLKTYGVIAGIVVDAAPLEEKKAEERGSTGARRLGWTSKRWCCGRARKGSPDCPDCPCRRFVEQNITINEESPDLPLYQRPVSNSRSWLTWIDHEGDQGGHLVPSRATAQVASPPAR